MAARDKLAPGLLVSALVVNYVVHKTDSADTICINGRRLLHTDTRLGRAAAVASWAALTGWLLPHFVNGPLTRNITSAIPR